MKTINADYFIKFLMSAYNFEDLPLDIGCEIAFFGRSNSGKSKALNVLFKKNKLSRSSKNPGKTMYINVFQISKKLRIIDLPGFGYAKVPKKNKLIITQLIEAYLKKRRSLKILIFLEDIRRSISNFDKKTIDLMLEKNIHILILLSKSDKVPISYRQLKLLRFKKFLNLHDKNKILSKISVYNFSALSREGIDSVKKKINSWTQKKIFTDFKN
ncbi:MAG: ribosome biogenesis GTP-binding protein YihA/YsxC [Wigglesworthia glossinidia]|nr:ribosome biogenesis GTP-binding protein YihA/YsxC [Wigglesworthia glossinidia]